LLFSKHKKTDKASKTKKSKTEEVKVYKTEAERIRFEETRAKIAAYQKKKLIRRIVILSALIVVLAGSGILISHVFGKLGEPPTVTFSPISSPFDEANAPEATFDPNDPNATSSEDVPATPIPGRKEGIYTFVIVGEDQGNGNTDTIIVGSYNDVDKKLTLVNIPRDTMVNVSWAAKKACTIYYLPTTSSHEENLKTQIKNLTGFTPDTYIAVSLEAFAKLVDTIGGVDFDIPIKMNYDDPTQNLHIHYNKGIQHLSGTDAMLVARFRQNNGGGGFANADIGRIANQQNLLKAVAKKALTPSNLLKYKEFAEIFDENVTTDLSVLNIAWYAQKILALDASTDIEFLTIPANTNDSYNGVSYVTIYVDEWLELVNEKLNPFEHEMTASDVNILTKNSKGVLYSTSGSIAGSSNWIKVGGSDSAKDKTASAGAATATPAPSSTSTPSDGTNDDGTTLDTGSTGDSDSTGDSGDGGLFYVPPSDNESNDSSGNTDSTPADSGTTTTDDTAPASGSDDNTTATGDEPLV